MAATKINLMKISAYTISANAVRGRSYKIFLHENLLYESFFTQKFPDLRYLCFHGLYIIMWNLL